MHGSSLKPTHGGDVLSRFPDLQGLMKSNEEWSEETRKADPELLQGLSKGQVCCARPLVHDWRKT